MRPTGETEGGESGRSGKGAAAAGAEERGRQRGDTYFFVKDFAVWYLFFNNLCLYSVP